MAEFLPSLKKLQIGKKQPDARNGEASDGDSTKGYRPVRNAAVTKQAVIYCQFASEVNHVNDKQRAFAAAKANKNLHPALKGNPAPSPAPPPAAAEVKAKKGKPA
jgi:hypothetical protein